MAKRPSLSEVIKRDEPSPGPTQSDPEATPGTEMNPASPASSQREPGKRRRGWLQLNVYVPKELRTAAKVKALQEGRDISDIVTELLEGWVADG